MNCNHLLADIFTDVTIREGSQQQEDLCLSSTAQKLEITDKLVHAGTKNIELTAFAPGPWFSDANSLIKGACTRFPQNNFKVIYFNTSGLQDLIAAKNKYANVIVEGIFHTAATNKYRMNNYKQRSVEHTIEKMKRLVNCLRENKLNLDTVVLSTAWGEHGQTISQHEVHDFCRLLLDSATKENMNIKKVVLADTVGIGTPETIFEMVKGFKEIFSKLIVCAHLHPPSKLALDCVHAGIDAGIDEWEGTLGGVGGSPFADKPGANLDLRCLIKAWKEKGWEHGFDLAALNEALEVIKTNVKHPVAEID